MKTSNLILLALGLFALGFIVAMTVIFCVKDGIQQVAGLKLIPVKPFAHANRQISVRRYVRGGLHNVTFEAVIGGNVIADACTASPVVSNFGLHDVLGQVPHHAGHGFRILHFDVPPCFC